MRGIKTPHLIKHSIERKREITFEFKKYFKNLFNLFLMSDLDILSLVRSENLDIAFDLSGYTKGNLLIFVFFLCDVSILLKW